MRVVLGIVGVLTGLMVVSEIVTHLWVAILVTFVAGTVGHYLRGHHRV